MSVRRVGFVTLVVALLCTFTGAASAGIVDACKSTCTILFTGATLPTPYPLTVCPAGDAKSFAQQGWWIRITVRDVGNNPIAGILAEDFWVQDCDPLRDIKLCGGGGSVNADADSDVNGVAEIKNDALAASGWANGLSVVVQGVVLQDPANSCLVKCISVCIRSVDIAPAGNPDGIADLIDLAAFAIGFPSPPKAFNPALDFNCDNVVDLIDLSIFALHFQHKC